MCQSSNNVCQITVSLLFSISVPKSSLPHHLLTLAGETVLVGLPARAWSLSSFQFPLFTIKLPQKLLTCCDWRQIQRATTQRSQHGAQCRLTPKPLPARESTREGIDDSVAVVFRFADRAARK